MSFADLDEQIRLADEAYDDYDYPKAVTEYKRALDMIGEEATSHQQEKKRSDVFLRIVDSLDMDGKWLDALMYISSIVNLARIKNNTRLEIGAHLRAGRILAKRGKWEEAKKKYLDVFEVTKKKTSISANAECYYGLAYLAWRQGDMDTAKINVDKTLKLVEEYEKSKYLKGKSLILLATLVDNHGDTELAIKKFKEAIAVLEEINGLVELSRAYNNLGEVYKGLEDYPTATEQYEKCVDVSRQSNDKHTEIYGLTNAAECLAREDKIAEADKHIKEARELLAALDDPYASAATHFVQGLIASYKKDQKTTHKEYNTAIDTLENLEAPYDLGIVLLEYGKALQAFGQKEEARKMYTKAKANFERTDAKQYLQKTEDSIRELAEA